MTNKNDHSDNRDGLMQEQTVAALIVAAIFAIVMSVGTLAILKFDLLKTWLCD